MRVIYLAVIALVMAAVGGTIAMVVFPKFRPGPVKEWVRQSRGYGPADTPEDALEKFRKAIKERDYETAATFVGGDYAEHMTKSADAGEKLALAIDALNENLESNSIKSDTSKQALQQLEPFPKELHVKGQLEKKGEVAYAWLYEEPLKLEKTTTEKWTTDPRMFRSMQPALAVPLVVRVEIKKDGKGYKLFFPPEWVNDRLRSSTERLRDNYGNYVRGIDQVKFAVKNEATTRENIERHLKEVIEAEAK